MSLQKMQWCATLSMFSAHSSRSSLPRLRTAVGARLSLEPRGSSGSASGLHIDNHSRAVYALEIICYDFGDAIEAQKTMTTRSIIVIPKLNQTRFFWFEVKYVSKVISEPRNETGVADSVTFRTKTAVSPRVGGRT